MPTLFKTKMCQEPGAVEDAVSTFSKLVVCNLEPELGTIETGKIADILVVTGDPLEELVDSLTRVNMVIHDGVIIVDHRSTR